MIRLVAVLEASCIFLIVTQNSWNLVFSVSFCVELCVLLVFEMLTRAEGRLCCQEFGCEIV